MVSLRNVTSTDKTVYALLTVIITCEKMKSVKKSAIIKSVLGITIHVIIALSKTQHTYMLTEVPYKMILREKEL